MNHILLCLLTLLFSLSGPAMGKYSDFLQPFLTAEVAANGGPVLRSYAWRADLSGGDAAGGIGGLTFIRFHLENKAVAVAADGQGNTSALYDMADGTQAATYEYGPFGEPLRASGQFAAVNPFRFSTKYEDHESGRLNFGLRIYDPQTGRWTSQDPLGEMGGLNLYGFVANNPVNGVDPYGLYLETAPSFSQIARVSIAGAAGTSAGLGIVATGDLAILPAGILFLNDMRQPQCPSRPGSSRVDRATRSQASLFARLQPRSQSHRNDVG